ncbi:DUF1127 domain-containing protein [uncultured Roseovarius sp.]|uniref:DUF1127 domain-containing protein n=1 Tax=uncultured Roseovarius sp. TaxID=293344 RepID=UPI00260996C1|nr:DUF1127 domain-containing protein [uncultured Roseovarius sp.]
MTHSQQEMAPNPLFAAAYPTPLVARLAIAFAVLVIKWDMNRRTRRQLARLDAHLLRDIGVDRHAAHAEAARLFWR